MFANLLPIRTSLNIASLVACLVVLFSSIPTVANASGALEPTLKFENLSAEDGLSQSVILDIVQDDRGFIWLATVGGLFRYDGSKFKAYRHQKEDSSSLPSNYIRKLFVTASNDIWVGTDNGLAKYNVEEDSFYRYELPTDTNDQFIWGIFELNSLVLVSTEESLLTYNIDKDTFSTLPKSKLTRNIKSAMSIGKNKWLLGSYENGLILYNNGVLERLSILPNEATSIYTIFQIYSDQIYLGTSSGLYILSSSESGDIKESLVSYIESPAVRDIKLVDDSVFIITEEGLSKLDAKKDLTSSYSPNYLEDCTLYTAYLDSDRNLWIGSDTGLYLNQARNRYLEQYIYTSISNNSSGSSINSISNQMSGFSWMATDREELAYFNLDDLNVISTLPFEYNVRSLYIDHYENLWIASDRGLFLKKQESPIAEHLVDNLDIVSMYIEDNYILLGTKKNGLVRFNIANNSTKEILDTENSSLYVTSSIKHESIVLIGTSRGLYVYDDKNGSLTYLDNIDTVNLEDKLYITNLNVIDGELFISTLGSGLYRINKDQAYIYNTSNGFGSDTVYDVEKVHDSFWVSTSNGLGKISSIDNNMEFITASDGLGIREFNSGASVSNLTSAVFGGINGIINIRTREENKEESEKYLNFESLSINNISVNHKISNKYLSKDIDSSSNIKLSYLDRRLSISMSVPGTYSPANTTFMYRLEGTDEDWFSTDGHNSRATYTNISHGEHTFIAFAKDRYDRWKTPKKTISIIVTPPLWLTKPAFVAYAMIIFSALALLIAHRNRRKQQQKQLAESEERLKLSLWGSGDELWDWNIRAGRIYRSNIWGKLEFPRDGRRNSDSTGSNIHPKDLPRVQESLNNHFRGVTQFYEASYRVKDKLGHWLWLLDRGKIVEKDEEGTPLRMTGTIKDISRLKKAEENLNLFARSVANISDAVFIMNKRFRIVEVNQAFCAITGYQENEVLHRSLRFRNYPPAFTPSVKRTLTSMGRWVGELQDTRSNGHSFFLELAIDAIHDETGDISHYVGVFSDITERKQTENELRKLANIDTLTELPNRSLFQANHNSLVSRSIRHALLVFDLDNFKMINDSLGHQAGDDLLCALSKRIADSCRQQDTLYRLGGDEFAILIDDTDDINVITGVAKQIQQLLVDPFVLSNQEHVVTASFGIVLFPLDGETSEELLRNADTAMYHAKSQGSNRYVFFSDSMNKTAVRQLKIETILRQAIRDDLFELNYQPKFDTQSGNMNGMEALVRLVHPDEGRISPVEFIPTAEENGLIIEIGDIVLRKACFAAEGWRKAGMLNGRIAVNVSAKQFMLVNLPERIQQALAITQLPANRLEIELTEGAFMEAPEKAITVMQEIQKMGVHISLDDFGTGYSSLAYLQRFPINTLKIDQTFVREMINSESGENMVRSILSIANNLNLSVIAEGVETVQQKEILTKLNCDTLQGYLLSRPLDEAAMKAFLDRQENGGIPSSEGKIA